MSKIIAYVVKNLALVIGILEAILKAVSGIVSLTPTKKDDKLLKVIDGIFSKIKKALYDKVDFLSN